MNRLFSPPALTAVLLLALAAPALHAQAPVPTTTSYQGALTEPDGDPVPDGAYTVALRLFTAAAGGSPVYAETHAVNTVGGVFSAELGAGTPVTGVWSTLTFSEGYWLETAIGGTTLAPRTKLLAVPYARALTLPYTGITDASGYAFTISTTGPVAVRGTTAFTSGAAYGGWFESSSPTGRGVTGIAYAASGPAFGVYGSVLSGGGAGVFGESNNSAGGEGVRGVSAGSSGRGVSGQATAPTGQNYGVYGLSESTAGRGVFGWAAATTGTTYGGEFGSASTSGRGLFGQATATSGMTYGVYGRVVSPSGRGVYGLAEAADGAGVGVLGQSFSTSPLAGGVQGEGVTGVYGRSTYAGGRGVYGLATQGGSTTSYGVYGESNATTGRGVYGVAPAASGTTYAVYGQAASTTGRGVYGTATATSGTNYGVFGTTASATGRAVYGSATATTGQNYGVFGTTGSSDGYAGYFSGRAHVTGTLSKGGGSFVIDHPLDPERRLLRHSFVESPDMMNVYNGNATLDAAGAAEVVLPDWFEALNRDFRYQLTPLGASMPGLFVAEEVRGNRFRIGGGVPGGRVSWQVTGIRHDAWAEENRIVVEEEKRPEQRGRYLHPSAFGQPRERGVDYDPELEAEQARLDEERAREAARRSAEETERAREAPRP